MRRNYLFYLVILLVIIPSTLSLDLGGSLSDGLGNLGKEIFNLINNQWFRYGIVFILFFMLLQAIYKTGLSKVPVFAGNNGEPNKSGRLIATSLALLSSIGIAYMSGTDFADRILGMMGLFGALALSLLVFGLAYFNLRDDGQPNWCMILIATGLALLTFGTILNGSWSGKSLASLGVVAILAGFICIFMRFRGGRPTNMLPGDGNRPPSGRGPGGGNPGNDDSGGGGSGGPPGNRPPGGVPPATPPRSSGDPTDPNDPPTPAKPTPGLEPGPKPSAPKEPRKPNIPDDKQVFIDLSIPEKGATYFNPIRSQGIYGACTAFAASSIYEYILQRHFGQRKRYLSPLFLWYYTRDAIGKKDANGGPSTCIVPMEQLSSKGDSYEDLWPFREANRIWNQEPSAQAYNDGGAKKIGEYHQLDPKDTDQWVHALFERNPINIAVHFPSDMSGYRKKLYDNFGSRHAIGGHAMVIVGYHSHYPYNGKGIKAFKIRNSHGLNWGENGYTWVPADVLKDMLWEEPLIITGWQRGGQKEAKKHCIIEGRVVFDEGNIQERMNGEYINKGDFRSPHEFIVGALAQVDGKVESIAEEHIKNELGSFKLEFDADLSKFEPLTMLPKRFKHFEYTKGIENFPGIVVYKRGIDERDKNMFFHVVYKRQSLGGRGGLGKSAPKNPCLEGSYSGRPIVFDEKYLVEKNVVIPITPSVNPRHEETEVDLKKLAEKTAQFAQNLIEEEKYSEDLDKEYSVLHDKLTAAEKDTPFMKTTALNEAKDTLKRLRSTLKNKKNIGGIVSKAKNELLHQNRKVLFSDIGNLTLKVEKEIPQLGKDGLTSELINNLTNITNDFSVIKKKLGDILHRFYEEDEKNLVREDKRLNAQIDSLNKVLSKKKDSNINVSESLKFISQVLKYNKDINDSIKTKYNDLHEVYEKLQLLKSQVQNFKASLKN